MRWSRERTTFFLSADPRITCVPNREGWSVRITGNPWTVCTTSGVEWFDTASSVHYYGFASTAYCNLSTFIWDRKKHPNRRHWFFSVKVTNTPVLPLCVSGCVTDTVTWPNKLRMGKKHTQRQLDGNKYRLLISDQFYLSGRCRYVRKWLTSADNNITADISCIPIIDT